MTSIAIVSKIFQRVLGREDIPPSKACSTLMASFALVSKYGIPPFDWQNVMARFEEICAGCE
jgi:hypothetical protein